MNEDFLTTEEVLDYLQVNLRTIYRLIGSGKMPAVRVGRQWRFRKKDIDHWLATHRQAARKVQLNGGARRRILVVDDEQAVRELVAKALGESYDVDTVGDGPTASSGSAPRRTTC